MKRDQSVPRSTPRLLLVAIGIVLAAATVAATTVAEEPVAAATVAAAPMVFGFGSVGTPPAMVAAPEVTPSEPGGKERTPGLSEFALALVRPSRQTVRELAPFSSLIDLPWDHPELIDLASYARSYEMKVLISLHALFFVHDDARDVSPPAWKLRPDYRSRWARFVALNREILGFGTVWSFYLVDEPFWNQIPVADLAAANRLVKATFPLISTMTSLNAFDVEAAPVDLPRDLFEVVGYHAYAVPQDPNVDPVYRYYLGLLREKLPSRDVVIVADAWWGDSPHGTAGLEPRALAARAHQYRQVAEEVGAVALGAFVWDSFAGGTGLRELPEEVLREYVRVGSEITGRCGVPASVGALAGETLLSLQGCRFSVRVHWRDPASGEEGEGIAAPLTRDTGMFWFFDPANIELTVKVLDGTSWNGHWWIYWSHMTSLEVRLEVTDTATGRTVTYSEPASDTAAFPGP